MVLHVKLLGRLCAQKPASLAALSDSRLRSVYETQAIGSDLIWRSAALIIMMNLPHSVSMCVCKDPPCLSPLMLRFCGTVLLLKALDAFYKEQLAQLEERVQHLHKHTLWQAYTDAYEDFIRGFHRHPDLHNWERYEQGKEQFHQAASKTEGNLSSGGTSLNSQLLSDLPSLCQRIPAHGDHSAMRLETLTSPESKLKSRLLGNDCCAVAEKPTENMCFMRDKVKSEYYCIEDPLYLVAVVIGMERWKRTNVEIQDRGEEDVCPQSIEKLSGCRIREVNAETNFAKLNQNLNQRLKCVLIATHDVTLDCTDHYSNNSVGQIRLDFLGHDNVTDVDRSRNTDPVCSGLQTQILSCYRENREQTLRCSDLAKEYMQCINAAKKQGQLLRRTHTHTHVSRALLRSTDVAGFGSNTQGVPRKVKSCLSDCRESETEPNRERSEEMTRTLPVKVELCMCVVAFRSKRHIKLNLEPVFPLSSTSWPPVALRRLKALKRVESRGSGVVRPINRRASAYHLGAPIACQSSDKMDFQLSQGSLARTCWSTTDEERVETGNSYLTKAFTLALRAAPAAVLFLKHES
ncbi:MICOS complex subunit mic25a [Collichthys lucidus]|uniref:MICOS complex subunit mic25a n=1 Tax=Collichthys lucidus TaxID=240159 RepID=A0A4U5URI4_COLLU|nr:MICOS complex subunit mic25a [Collichthys lucidus]